MAYLNIVPAATSTPSAVSSMSSSRKDAACTARASRNALRIACEFGAAEMSPYTAISIACTLPIAVNNAEPMLDECGSGTELIPSFGNQRLNCVLAIAFPASASLPDTESSNDGPNSRRNVAALGLVSKIARMAAHSAISMPACLMAMLWMSRSSDSRVTLMDSPLSVGSGVEITSCHRGESANFRYFGPAPEQEARDAA